MMFSDFEKAFFKEKERNNQIPKEIIESLGEDLPEGFKYADIGEGACGIMSTSPELNIGVKIEIPKDLLENFKPSSMQELMEYLYRTQRELKVIPDKEGCITINGQKFKINEIVKFPLDDKITTGTQFYIRPAPFQKPFNLTIEGGGIKKNVKIQRQPYADMHKSFFKGIIDDILEITYIIDEIKQSLSMTVKINIEKSKKVKDIVEGLKLYQACLNGQVKLGGVDFPTHSNSQENTAINKTIEYWDRILQLQKELNIEFNIEFPIKMEDTMWIEKLYRCFIEKKPYKQYVEIDKIRTEQAKGFEKENIINSKGLMLLYIQSSELDIWGVKLNMYDTVALFDLRVRDAVSVNTEKMEYDLLIEPITDKGIYQSIRHFTTKEDADNYRERVKELQNAELLTIE